MLYERIGDYPDAWVTAGPGYAKQQGNALVSEVGS
jgi:hypothetical protein